MSMARYFQIFMGINLISIFLLAFSQASLEPEKGVIPFTFFYLIIPFINILVLWVFCYLPFYFSKFFFDKATILIKIFMAVWAFLILSIFFHKDINGSLNVIKIDIDYMSQHLQEDRFLFVSEELPRNRIWTGDRPLVKNIRTGRENLLSCNIYGVASRCNYIGDKKFKGGVHNVKFYQMRKPYGSKSLIFEISGYQDFYIKDFVKSYKNTQTREVLNLVFYIFSFLLTMVLIIGLKIKS